MENLFILALFVTCFIAIMFIAAGIELILRRVFRKGMFPDGYFKSERDWWQKW